MNDQKWHRVKISRYSDTHHSFSVDGNTMIQLSRKRDTRLILQSRLESGMYDANLCELRYMHYANDVKVNLMAKRASLVLKAVTMRCEALQDENMFSHKFKECFDNLRLFIHFFTTLKGFKFARA